MQPEPTVRTVESLAYEGWFSVDTITALGAAVAVVIVLSAVFDWRYAKRRWPLPFLWLCRTFAFAVVFYALLGPTRITTTTKTTPRTLGFYIDTSASMDTRDPPETLHSWGADATSGAPAKSRLDLVAGWVQSSIAPALARLRDDTHVRWNTFSGDVSEIPDLGTVLSLPENLRHAGSDPSRHSSDLASAFRHASRATATGTLDAAVVVTDGAHNTATDPAAAAAALRSVPSFLLRIGNPTPLRDVFLHQVSAPAAVIENDPLTVEGLVTAIDCPAESTTLQLLDGDRVLDQTEINFDSTSSDHRFALRWEGGTTGLYDLTVRVAPLPDEFTEDNNAAEVPVHVVTEKIRILLADATPRYEYRYLENLFNRDETLDATNILFSATSTSDSGESFPPTLPFDIDEWSRYHVIILGDLSTAQLTPEQQQHLYTAVSERGHTLIIIAGRADMPHSFAGGPIATLAPVTNDPVPATTRQTGFVVSLPDSDLPHPAVRLEADPSTNSLAWTRMTASLPIYHLSDYSAPKPAAHVLVQARSLLGGAAPPRAFIAWHDVGKGRVAYLAAPASYQLRYLKGDLYHYRFWGQFLRWTVSRALAPGSRNVRIAAGKHIYAPGEPVTVTIRLSDNDGKPVPGATGLVVATPDTERKQDPDAASIPIPQTEGGGVGVADFAPAPDEPGTYNASIASLPAGHYKIRIESSTVDTLLAAEDFEGTVEAETSVAEPINAELSNTRSDPSRIRDLAEAAASTITTPGELAAQLESLDLSPSVQRTVSRSPLWDRWLYFALIAIPLCLEWAGRKYLGLV